MGKPDYASALKQSQHLPPLKCCWVRGCAVFIFWDKCLMAWASFQQGMKAKFGMFNRIQQYGFQADLAAALTWSLGTQVPCPGGTNSYPDNFCRESSGEKASGWHWGINGNNIWQAGLLGLTRKTGFIISQTQTANCARWYLLFFTTVEEYLHEHDGLEEMISRSNATFQPFLIYFLPFCCQKLQNDPYFAPF